MRAWRPGTPESSISPSDFEKSVAGGAVREPDDSQVACEAVAPQEASACRESGSIFEGGRINSDRLDDSTDNALTLLSRFDSASNSPVSIETESDLLKVGAPRDPNKPYSVDALATVLSGPHGFAIVGNGTSDPFFKMDLGLITQATAGLTDVRHAVANIAHSRSLEHRLDFDIQLSLQG